MLFVSPTGGYIYFISGLEWAEEIREEFEEKARDLQRDGLLSWELMKVSPLPYYEEEHSFAVCF